MRSKRRLPRVEFVPNRGDGVRGWFTAKTATISAVDSFPVSSQVRTLLHELACLTKGSHQI